MNKQSTMYEGKTLTFFVAQPFQSGNDITARTLVPYLQRSIPGNPEIVVENRVGNGGATAMHYYLKEAKHDGLSIIMSSSGTVTRWVQRAPHHDYDLTRLDLLLSTTTGRIWFVNANLGVRNVRELKELSLTRPLKSAHPAPDSLPAGVEKLVMNLLELKVDQKYGYGDYVPDCIDAVLGCEVELSCLPGRVWNVVKPYLVSGEIIPLFQDGVGPNLERASNVPDVMNLPETYRYLFGKEPDQSVTGYQKLRTFLGLTLMSPLWIHNDAPPEAIKTLRYGIDQVLHLPEFRQVAREMVGSDDVSKGFIYGDRTGPFLKEFFARRDEIAALFKGGALE